MKRKKERVQLTRGGGGGGGDGECWDVKLD